MMLVKYFLFDHLNDLLCLCSLLVGHLPSSGMLCCLQAVFDGLNNNGGECMYMYLCIVCKYYTLVQPCTILIFFKFSRAPVEWSVEACRYVPLFERDNSQFVLFLYLLTIVLSVGLELVHNNYHVQSWFIWGLEEISSLFFFCFCFFGCFFLVCFCFVFVFSLSFFEWRKSYSESTENLKPLVHFNVLVACPLNWFWLEDLEGLPTAGCVSVG